MYAVALWYGHEMQIVASRYSHVHAGVFLKYAHCFACYNRKRRKCIGNG